MIKHIQNHVRSLNEFYKEDLSTNNIKYYNAYASFIDPHTISLDNGKSKERVRAKRIVIAVGQRPLYPGIPGDKDFGITSDDLFSLSRAPGKTLIVGTTQYALETAGVLTSLGFECTLMMRTPLLRGFDTNIVQRLEKQLEDHNAKFI